MITEHHNCYPMQVAATSTMVMQTADQADAMFNDATDTIERANGVGTDNRLTASNLLNRATDAANLSRQYQDVSRACHIPIFYLLSRAISRPHPSCALALFDVVCTGATSTYSFTCIRF